MSYLLPAGILAVVNERKLKEMFEIEGDGSFPTTKLQEVINAVESQVHAELGATYVIPITGSQSIEIVKGIELSLVSEALYTYGEDGAIPERITKMGERGRAILSQYAGDPLVNSGKPSKYLPDAVRHAKSSVVVEEAMSYKGA